MACILNLPTSFLAELAASALRASAVAIVAALGLGMFRIKATSLRLSAWTIVLYTALAIPLLGRLLPTLPVPLPEGFRTQDPRPVVVQFAQEVEKVSRHRTSTNTEVWQPSGKTSASTAAVSSSRGASLVVPVQPSFFNRRRLMAIATGLYFLVALILLVRLCVGIVLTRRLIRVSRPIGDQRLAALQTTNGLRISESDLITVPVTAGVWRSATLLPADWRTWEDVKLNAVLAHEASHVARCDALTQRLSLIHRAVFWFSPLAWWLDRHLSVLAEEASDDAALSCGTNRDDYARTLLGFFEALQAAPSRVRWQGVSMAKAGQAEERLERILSWKGSVPMNFKKSVAVVLVACAIPVVYLAASASPISRAGRGVEWQEPTPAPAAPAAIPAPAPKVLPSPASTPEPEVAPVAPSDEGIPASAPAPVTAADPTPPAAGWWSGQSHGAGTSYGGYWYGYDSDDLQRFVIVTGKSDAMTMSGTSEDAHHAQQLKKKISGDFIWFERDEKSYIIRDQATIDRARKLWAPQEELGRKQEELGRKQEELGRQQEVLGRKMEGVRVRVPDMSAELEQLKAKLQKLGSSATMDQIGDLQSEIGALQSKLGAIQSEAGVEQGRFGNEQGELGRKQGELGRQQGELGRQQGELARKASVEMRELLDEAIKNGKAQPEPETGKASL